MKVREAAVAKREAELTRQAAATLSGNVDAVKREAELAAREQALVSQLAEIKAAEIQLQEKKLEAKELQVRGATVTGLYCFGCMQRETHAAHTASSQLLCMSIVDNPALSCRS